MEKSIGQTECMYNVVFDRSGDQNCIRQDLALQLTKSCLPGAAEGSPSQHQCQPPFQLADGQQQFEQLGEEFRPQEVGGKTRPALLGGEPTDDSLPAHPQSNYIYQDFYSAIINEMSP